MRIQHNIAAMNSYRNFSGNTSKLNKNLEKLSTGYKINRAGDDAAGLAISEKMRVQISGLEGATKNAKDGISLVQTAEGALTEVHDMLNRMVTLTESSANGTYDDSLDRNQLQKEVSALQTEIDRIADSTNYNGIKLLDGSLAGANAGAATSASVALKVTGFKDYVTTGSVTYTDAAGSNTATGSNAILNSSVTFTASSNVSNSSSANVGDKLNISIEMTDGTSRSYDLTISGSSYIMYNGEKLDKDGTQVTVGQTTANTLDASDLAKITEALLKKDDTFTEQYDISVNAGKVQITGTNANFTDAGIKSVTVSKANGTRQTEAGKTEQATLVGGVTIDSGVGDFQEIKMGCMTAYSTTDPEKKERKSTFEVDGQKFGFAKDVASAKELGEDVNVVFTDNTNPNETDVTAMVKLINQKLGTNVTAPGTGNGTTVAMISKRGYDKATGNGGLTLQIGDTSDSFNQLNVSIEDMHAKSMGVGDVDISTQQGAAEAIDKIKSAVNYVSNTRGTLGALQNRLDHTINNLGVMRENIQSAESLIRDTDVAEEMMTYTKNNILNQSAQAMLAQANQLPQGVLQLLG